MSELAHEIVDNLVEGTFSDEEMAGFADAAGFIFHWNYEPHANGADKPAGNYRLEFKVLQYRATGTIYLYLSSSFVDLRKRGHLRFSVNVQYGLSQTRANTRVREVVITWNGIDDLKTKFEDFVRGPVASLLASGAMTPARLVSATTKLCKSLSWTASNQLASPEEIEKLKQRFEYGQEKGPDSHRHRGMFDDPRVEGRETDYDYLTSEDVRFWNTLADEYDARRTQ